MSQRHPDASAIDCWRKRSGRSDLWWRVLWPSSGSHVPRKNHKYVFRNTYTNKSSKFRLKHSTCKPCINEECNGTLVIGSKFQAEEEILTIVCSNISANCHPPVTLAKFDMSAKRKVHHVIRYVNWTLLFNNNRMHAQDLHRECDREKRRCLDSLWMPLKRDFALQESWDQYYLQQLQSTFPR